MGKEISHCGGIGNGQVLKLMNNMLIFQNVTALAEAMAIATRAGVDRAKVFEILSKGIGRQLLHAQAWLAHGRPANIPTISFPWSIR